MSTKKQIFITGASGYIGGAVLERLLKHHTASESEITVLIRKPDKAAAFESLGVKTVIGSYDDLDLLEKQASLSDVVFTCADADNLKACEAILRGLKKRHEATGTLPILIHTSGTGVLIDQAGGMFASETIWDDTNLDQLETLPDTQLHRNVDLAVIAADKKGYARTYLVLPPTVYGKGEGKLVDLGVRNPLSIQIPGMIAASIERKRGGVVGQGLNIWPNVHIDDLTEFYMVVYEGALDGRGGHGREGFYFAENGEHALKDISIKIAEALHDLGASDAREPTPFDDAEYIRNPLLPFQGTNARCKANRARALGWKPKYTTKDMLNSIKGEVEWQLEHKA